METDHAYYAFYLVCCLKVQIHWMTGVTPAVAKESLMVAKTTSGRLLELPLHLVEEIIAPSTCQDPSFCAAWDKQQKRKLYSICSVQCASYTLEYIAAKTLFTCIPCLISVQKNFESANILFSNPSDGGRHCTTWDFWSFQQLFCARLHSVVAESMG